MRIDARLALFLGACTLVCGAGSRPVLAQDGDAPKVSQEPGKTVSDRFEEDGEGKESDFIRKRMAWFHDSRAFPGKTIPRGVRQAAIKERDRKVALERALREAISPETTPAEPAWTLIGPQPLTFGGYGIDAGRVTAIAIDPTNPKVVYMGGAEGGVWKSTNGGTSWKSMTDAEPSLAVGSITIDPLNHNTIFVGTGEENFSGDSYYGAGVLKSTDGGVTWTQSNSSSTFSDNPCGGDWIGAIAVHPTNDKIVLAAVEPCYYGYPGIYRSTDGGVTWTAVYTQTNGWIPATSILFDHANGNIAYAGTYDGGGVLKSTDGGVTWNAANGSGVNSLPDPSSGGRIALAMAPSNSSVLYAAIANPNNSDLLGMYKTTDGGANWSALPNAPNFCSTQCWYNLVLAVHPTNPNFVVAGGVYTYHPGGSAVTTSQDGGTTWVDQSSGLHPDTHALAFSPDGTKLYVGDDGGMFMTDTPAANMIGWTSLNSTLAITEFYPGISMDQGNVNHTYIGAQDNATEKYTGTLEWSAVACGDGGSTLIDYAETSVIYTNCIGQSFARSADDGNSWYGATNGLNSNDRTAWVPPTAIDPQHHNTLYFGTYRVYQTTDAAGLVSGAGQWNAISGDLTNPKNTNANGTLSTLAVARTDPNTIYSGSNDGEVQVTRNALSTTGATWTSVTTSSLPYRGVNWIAVDPTVATTAYVGFSGFTGFGDSLGHIFKTTNAGGIWTDVSGNLPNTPVDAILVDPDAPETVFIGTDIGAFYTTTGGTSWSRLGTGLPNVVVTGLGLHENSRTLRASTHGRSVWDLNVATLLPVPTINAVSPATAMADAPFKLTVTGVQFNTKSVVVFGGKALTTTYVNGGEVTAVANPAAGGSFAVYVMNGAGGKLSNPATVTVDNPLPTLTALSKTSVVAPGAAFTLTVTGTKFVTTSKIVWKGTALATTFVSTTALTAAIPAADLGSAGTVAVTVENPAPAGGVTLAKTFTIDNPPPTLTALSKTSVVAPGAAFTLTVTGTKFVTTSKIVWKGVALATKFISGTSLSAAIPATDLASAGTVAVTVDNPAPAGGVTLAKTFTIENPAPTLTALSKTSVVAPGAAFTLTVTGTNFVSTSKIVWKGTALATTFVSRTALTAAIPATDLASAGTVAVTVDNPAPGGGVAVAKTFTIDNPAPVLKTISPTTGKLGGAAFTLTVTGTGFVAASKVSWNGVALATTYAGAAKLTAAVPAADLAKAGTALVTVASPAPGGGTSVAVKFTVP